MRHKKQAAPDDVTMSFNNEAYDMLENPQYTELAQTDLVKTFKPRLDAVDTEETVSMLSLLVNFGTN